MIQIADEYKGKRVRVVFAKTKAAPLMEVVGDFVAHDFPDQRGERVVLSLRPDAGTTVIEGPWIREMWLTASKRPIQLPRRYQGEMRMF